MVKMRCETCGQIIGKKEHTCPNYDYMKGENSVSKRLDVRNKISKAMTGRHFEHSEETKEKIRLTKIKDKNPNWKGDNVQKECGNLRARRWF